MKCTIVIVMFSLLAVSASAQQGGTSAGGGSTPSSPIDVPDIIVKGSATLRLMTTTFLKQTPSATSPLTRRELDSLNPKQKHEILALAPASPPSEIPLPHRYDGMVSASVGMFQTPEVAASYDATVLGYATAFEASYMATQGYQSATDMHSLSLGIGGHRQYRDASGPLGSEYHDWSLSTRSVGYSLFAVPDSASRRNVTRFGISSTMDHVTSLMRIHSELSLGSVAMDESLGSTVRSSEQQLRLVTDFTHASDETDHRVRVAVDVRPFASVLMSDNALSYEVSTLVGGMNVSGRVGVRGGTNSASGQVVDVIGGLDARRRLTSSVVAGITVYRNLENTFFSRALADNPYVRTDALFDFTRVAAGSEVYVKLTPTRFVMCDVRLGYDAFTSFRVPVFDSGTAFRLQYVPARRTRLRVHAEWQTGSLSDLTFDTELRSVVGETDETIPYQAALTSRVGYLHRFGERWTAEIGVSYTSSRRTTSTDNATLPGYLFVDGRVQFAMTRTLAAFLSTQNLTNSSIFVFERYRERTAFASLGLQWKF